MKGITLKLEELTDSKEVMESKEPPKIRWFIFIFLLILIFAVIFSSLFYVDEYVKVLGEVKTVNNSSDVVLTSNCRLANISISDGQLVSKGDLLFSFDVDYAKEQHQILEETEREYEKQLSFIERLKQSIEQEENLFSNEGDESEYYYRYEEYAKKGELAQHDIDSSKLNNTISNELKDNELESAKKNKKEKCDLLSEYEVLTKCIDNGETYSGSNKLLKSSFIDYETELKKAEVVLEQSKSSYDQITNAYKIQQSQEKITLSDVLEAKNKVDEAEQEIELINKKYIQLADEQIQQIDVDNESSDSLTTNEKKEAWTQLKNAIDKGDIYNGSDSEVSDIYEEYKLNYNSQIEIYNEYEHAYAEIQIAYEAQKNQTIISQNDVDNAKLSYENAQLDVQSVKNNYITQIQTTINSLKNEIEALNDTILNLQTELSGTEDIDKYEANSSENRKNEALISLNNELNNLKSNIKSTKLQIIDLEETIKNSEITATCDGTVTLLNEMNIGDIIQAGTKLCSILPNNDQMKALLYIPESEITKIQLGQSIEYVFDSMPYTEFGRITGKLQSVSLDAISSNSGDGKYYVANASFDELYLQNSEGEIRTVQSGMIVKAKIINSSKKVIIWLLEKINLVD